jgi:DNA-binding MarR family transcriptional regulator
MLELEVRFMIAFMNPSIGDRRVPLFALLAQALVAFTIEFDNEFEIRTPHRTSDYGVTPGEPHAPWLVSMVMWTKFLRFVPDEGTSVKELLHRSGSSAKELKLWLARLSRWWGYVKVHPAEAGAEPAGTHLLVRPTRGGRKALAVWRPLTQTIESRWQERFGRETIESLRESLITVASKLDPRVPDSLPILGYGLFSMEQQTAKGSETPLAEPDPSLPGLLSKVLFAFAQEFERQSEVSLAIAANVLRLAGDAGVAVRDLPRLSGVSKEAIVMAVSWLEKRSLARVVPESPGGRLGVLVLTAGGRHAKQACEGLFGEIEERWRACFGGDNILALRIALEKLIGKPGAQPSPLMAGLQPHPACWRARLPAPQTLPYYPMILHRGGFPDGS